MKFEILVLLLFVANSTTTFVDYWARGFQMIYLDDYTYNEYDNEDNLNGLAIFFDTN